MVIILVGLATLIGSVILNARHQRRITSLDGRRHHTVAIPGAILYSDRALTADEAETLKNEWISRYGR